MKAVYPSWAESWRLKDVFNSQEFLRAGAKQGGQRNFTTERKTSDVKLWYPKENEQPSLLNNKFINKIWFSLKQQILLNLVCSIYF